MWCRSDARLWHYYSAFSARGVFQTLVWHQHYYSAFSARGVFQTLVWHQYYYSAFFRSRNLSDTRLAPVLLFCIFPLEESFRHSFCPSFIILPFSARGIFQPLVWPLFYYSAFFRSRSLSDTRLAPVLLFCIFRSRSLSDTRLAPSIYYLYV